MGNIIIFDFNLETRNILKYGDILRYLEIIRFSCKVF